MVLFFQKKPAQKYQPLPQQEYIPVDIVQRLASQGMSEPEIISQLRMQGFSPAQIDKALSQAIKTAISLPPKEPPQVQLPQQPSRGMPPEKVIAGPQIKAVTQTVRLPEPPSFDFSPQPQEFTFEETPQEFVEKPLIPKEVSGPEITLEEVIEGIVSDRLSAIDVRLNSLDQRDQQLEQKIEDLRKQIDQIHGLMSKSEQTYVVKLDDFGEHVSGIESRIGSIEKAFKDFLPDLMENVRLMANVVDKMKKEERKI